MKRIKQYEPLWKDWYVEEKLGEGGFGAVYRIYKEKAGIREYSAVKLIRNELTETEVNRMRISGVSDAYISQALDRRIEKSKAEIEAMLKLKGISEIVSIEEYDVKKLEDRDGYDVLIRMELLDTLEASMMQNSGMDPDEIASLGIDICTALDYCEQVNIVHKDIKPSNIFINSKFGKYKLGDFGLARRIDQSMKLSKSGTNLYISPEVFLMKKAGFNSDLYSLGLVLYVLLNQNRLPFFPAQEDMEDEFFDHDLMMEAIDRRLSGDEIQPPEGDRGDLWKIIKKACQYKREDRYSHAREMKQDLMDYQRALRRQREEEKKALALKTEMEEEAGETPVEERGVNIQPDYTTPQMDQLVSAGSSYLFGSYPQDTDPAKKRQIDWIVLDIREDKALLVSKYVIDCKQYHSVPAEISWEECDLRAWLNQTFCQEAFSPEEQARICASPLKAEVNPMYHTGGGQDTVDRVFLLSISEAKEYFASDQERACSPTSYAIMQGAYADDDTHTNWWWLRSSGDLCQAAGVGMDGEIFYEGDDVSNVDNGVRPALWICL